MFGILRERAQKVIQLDADAILKEILDDPGLQDEIVKLNQQQLLAGKGQNDDSLPRYDEDSYFKTYQAAKVYEAWKLKISPNPNKDPGTMDFFINGQFHSSLKVKNAPKAFTVSSDSSIADDVQRKTNDNALGINDDSLNVLIPIIKERLITAIRNQIFA